MSTLAFVGSMTKPAPFIPAAHGAGISVFAFDDGALRLLSVTADIDNPTFLALHPTLPVLYATTEHYRWNEGTVSAYRIDLDSGRLTYLNKQPTLGSVAAHLLVTVHGRHLLVSNYRKGEVGELPGRSLAVLPIRDDGSLAPVCASVTHHGRGTVADRQDGPHPHATAQSPDGRIVMAADLGTDEVIAYRFDAVSGDLNRVAALALPPGTGPRHLAWHPNGRMLFVNGELDQTVSALAWDGSALHLLGRHTTLPPGFEGVNHSADLRVSPGGRFVYCSNRGHDSIAVFATDTGGALNPRGHAPTGGATPRGFCLSPDGAWLLAANQDSDTLVAFRRDASTGALTRAGSAQPVATPMCVTMRREDPHR